MASIEGKRWTEQELNFWDYKLDTQRDTTLEGRRRCDYAHKSRHNLEQTRAFLFRAGQRANKWRPGVDFHDNDGSTPIQAQHTEN